MYNAGEDKVNGKHVYVLTALLDASSAQDQFTGSMFGDMSALLGDDFVEVVLGGMKAVPVTLYI